MKIRSLSPLCFISHFLLCSQINAQQFPDSLLLAESVSNIQQVYLHEIGDNAQIYHGREYIRNGLRASGFPFFESDNMVPGSISYQGTTYPGRNMYYDMVSDEIIINGFLNITRIALSPVKADSFRIGSHFFVHLSSDRSNLLPGDGYYEQLYSGEPGVYVKRSKSFVSAAGTEDPKYLQKDSYFLKIHNTYHLVDAKNTLLELLKDRKDDLKKYMRVNKLNFKRNFETSLVESAIYYSHSKP